MPTSAPGPEGRVRSPSAYERAKSLYEAYSLAVGLAPSAVAEKTGYALGEILKGLLPGFVEMLVVVGATTAIGGALGGVIGFFFGGVGAAPGVVIGGEIGLNVGMAAITWLGLGFLVVAIAQGFGELWSTLSRGVERAWAAPEYSPRQYPHEIGRAAKEMADAVGILMLIILQGLVAWILKRAAVKSTASAISTANRAGALGGRAAADEALVEALAELRKSRLGGEFANWVERNWKTLRDDPRLKVKVKDKVGPNSVQAPTKQIERPTGNSRQEVSTLPKPIKFSGDVWRFTPKGKEGSAFTMHPGNVAANHRYSGPGLGAIYTGTSEKAMLGEAAYYGIEPKSMSVVNTKLSIENVLDLTDPAVRRSLGVTESQLTSGSDAGAYSVTQELGRKYGNSYNAFLVPSAREPGTTNLVIFNPGAIK